MIDRVAVNRALAKALAYKQCGRDVDAAAWAVRLVELLEVADILSADAVYAFGGWQGEPGEPRRGVRV